LVLKSKKLIFRSLFTIYIIFIVVIFSSFYDPWVPSEQYLKKIEKKIPQSISVNEPIINLFYISPDQICYYKIMEHDLHKGYLVIAKAPSKHHFFDFYVILDNQINISKVEILKYRENWGYEISNKKWLRQFQKLYDSKLGSRHHVQAISGATISATSLCNYIDKILDHLKSI